MSPEGPRSKRRGAESDPFLSEAPPQGQALLDDLEKELAQLENATEPSDSNEGGGTPSEAAPETDAASAPPQQGRSPSKEEPRAGKEGSTAPGAAQLQEMSRALELARAENGSLRSALALQQTVEAELRRDLAAANLELEATRSRSRQASDRFVPAAPVAFLSLDGKSVARRAFYTLGRGEGLEQLLAETFERWGKTGLPLVPTFEATTGLTLSLEGDPQRRFVRILPSGIHLVHLSEEELGALGELPQLVRSRKLP